MIGYPRYRLKPLYSNQPGEPLEITGTYRFPPNRFASHRDWLNYLSLARRQQIVKQKADQLIAEEVRRG